MTNPAQAAEIAAALKAGPLSTIAEIYSEFWNTVQGLDSFTNLTSVGDGCAYNLHQFSFEIPKAQQPAQPEQPGQTRSGSTRASRELRPEGARGADPSGKLRPPAGTQPPASGPQTRTS